MTPDGKTESVGTQDEAGPRRDGSRPRWFLALRLWTTLPLLLIVALIGWSVGHVFLAVGVVVAYLVLSLVFGRWARGNRARIQARLRSDRAYRERYNERSTRIARFFGLYFVGLFALLGVFLVIVLIVKIA